MFKAILFIAVLVCCGGTIVKAILKMAKWMFLAGMGFGLIEGYVLAHANL